MAPEIRPITADELAAFYAAMGVPFGFDPKPKQFERFKNTFELARPRYTLIRITPLSISR